MSAPSVSKIATADVTACVAKVAAALPPKGGRRFNINSREGATFFYLRKTTQSFEMGASYALNTNPATFWNCSVGRNPPSRYS